MATLRTRTAAIAATQDHTTATAEPLIDAGTGEFEVYFDAHSHANYAAARAAGVKI
jgi:hypothetical protein